MPRERWIDGIARAMAGGVSRRELLRMLRDGLAVSALAPFLRPSSGGIVLASGVVLAPAAQPLTCEDPDVCYFGRCAETCGKASTFENCEVVDEEPCGFEP